MKTETISKSRLNILVIRNDKLGDFMLAWPAFALLKKHFPDCRITALVTEYTKPIAEQCQWIDDTITDHKIPSRTNDIKVLSSNIRKHEFDVSISFFSEFRTAAACWLAGIPTRIAPATKIAQIFYTHTLKQRRSKSEKPEYEYNKDLTKYMIQSIGEDIHESVSGPFLTYDKDEIRKIKELYCQNKNIDNKRTLLILHPGSGGSAINLTPDQYSDLAGYIYNEIKPYFIITAGPGESDIALDISKKLKNIDHSVYTSTKGLVYFSKFIGICDMFISGSTGPLHLAGALNKPTAAFYPARRSATSLRWQTINDKNIQISFMPAAYKGDSDMLTLDIKKCAHEICHLIEKIQKIND